MYDYYLGGCHNYAVDREMARQALAALPNLRKIAWANRAFLRRVVRYLCAAGVDQFLDLGSGIPTVGNVHEIAHLANPAARVAYVDVDAVAVSHSNALLAGSDRAVAVQADLRDPAAVLTHPEVRAVLDLDRPVAVLMLAVLHFIPDTDDPAGVVTGYADALPEGGYLAISHTSRTEVPPSVGGLAVLDLYDRHSSSVLPRSREELLRFFARYELVDPGLVPIPLWRPDAGRVTEDPEVLQRAFFGGLGRLARLPTSPSAFLRPFLRQRLYGFRATAPYPSTAFTASTSPSGRHNEIDTRPGSSISRPSKQRPICSGLRTM